MSLDSSGFSPIGGWSVPAWGGWITTSNLASDGSTDSTPPGGGKVLDVQLWQSRVRYKETRLTMSGLLGCPTSRRVAVAHDFRLQVLWNPTQPPEAQLRAASGLSVSLLLGASPDAMHESDLAVPNFVTFNYPSIQGVKIWHFPIARLVEITPLVDSMHHNLIGEVVSMQGLGHGFFLPDDGTKLQAYLAYLNSTNTSLLR